MKQVIKDLIEAEMEQCFDYTHWRENTSMTEDEVQCYIDGYKSALMVIEQYITEDDSY